MLLGFFTQSQLIQLTKNARSHKTFLFFVLKHLWGPYVMVAHWSYEFFQAMYLNCWILPRQSFFACGYVTSIYSIIIMILALLKETEKFKEHFTSLVATCTALDCVRFTRSPITSLPDILINCPWIYNCYDYLLHHHYWSHMPSTNFDGKYFVCVPVSDLLSIP